MNTANAAPDRPNPPHSIFVTVVAWVFIVLSSFAVLASLFQNIMINLVFPFNEMQTAMQEAEVDLSMPWFVKIELIHFRILAASFLVIEMLTLGTAIGLLKRKNWARYIFVGIMGLCILFCILWGLVLLGLVGAWFYSFSEFAQSPVLEDGQGSELIVSGYIMVGFTVAISIGLIVLFGWIIKKLVSPEIRREFSDGQYP